MLFGHSASFHLINESILGISDAVNGCFHEKFALSVRPSVRPSDRPSVIISFPLSILSIFKPILFKLYIRVDVGEE